MRTLEAKHVAPYFPHKLRYANSENTEYTFPVESLWSSHVTLSDDDSGFENVYFGKESHLKPILRPISDINKVIQVNGDRICPRGILEVLSETESTCDWSRYSPILEYIDDNEVLIEDDDMRELPYWAMEKLFEWHIDIYGLIKDGLAVDINTLEQ